MFAVVFNTYIFHSHYILSVLNSNLFIFCNSDDSHLESKQGLEFGHHAEYNFEISRVQTPYSASSITIGELDGSNQGMPAALNQSNLKIK